MATCGRCGAHFETNIYGDYTCPACRRDIANQKAADRRQKEALKNRPKSDAEIQAEKEAKAARDAAVAKATPYVMALAAIVAGVWFANKKLEQRRVRKEQEAAILREVEATVDEAIRAGMADADAAVARLRAEMESRKAERERRMREEAERKKAEEARVAAAIAEAERAAREAEERRQAIPKFAAAEAPEAWAALGKARADVAALEKRAAESLRAAGGVNAAERDEAYLSLLRERNALASRVREADAAFDAAFRASVRARGKKGDASAAIAEKAAALARAKAAFAPESR